MRDTRTSIVVEVEGSIIILRSFLIACVAAVALGGCSSNKNDASEKVALKPLAAHTTGGDLTFTAPAGWVPESPASPMRKAQYRLPRVEGDAEDAEMVVFFFQGQGGSLQANIDRWIGQFTKADGKPAADAAHVSRRQSHGIPLTIVDVSGTYSGGGPMMSAGAPKPGFRMVAAVAETGGGPYFFKLTGPEKTVAKWEASFQSFLDTIQQ